MEIVEVSVGQQHYQTGVVEESCVMGTTACPFPCGLPTVDAQPMVKGLRKAKVNYLPIVPLG